MVGFGLCKSYDLGNVFAVSDSMDGAQRNPGSLVIVKRRSRIPLRSIQATTFKEKTVVLITPHS